MNAAARTRALRQPLLLQLTALFGLPGDRAARLAARRAFVEMKQCFIDAVARVPGAIGDSLRHKVRQSANPVELWRLRRAVWAALPAMDPCSAEHRAALQRHLDSLFPDSGDTTSFVAL